MPPVGLAPKTGRERSIWTKSSGMAEPGFHRCEAVGEVIVSELAAANATPYGQNIRHIISLCLKNSDEPEKNRFFGFSAGARQLRVHFAAMPAGFMNQLLRDVQFNDCEDTNRGCMGHRYAMGSDAGLYTGLVDQELLLRTEYLGGQSVTQLCLFEAVRGGGHASASIATVPRAGAHARN